MNSANFLVKPNQGKHSTIVLIHFDQTFKFWLTWVKKETFGLLGSDM